MLLSPLPHFEERNLLNTYISGTTIRSMTPVLRTRHAAAACLPCGVVHDLHAPLAQDEVRVVFVYFIILSSVLEKSGTGQHILM